MTRGAVTTDHTRSTETELLPRRPAVASRHRAPRAQVDRSVDGRLCVRPQHPPSALQTRAAVTASTCTGPYCTVRHYRVRLFNNWSRVHRVSVSHIPDPCLVPTSTALLLW